MQSRAIRRGRSSAQTVGLNYLAIEEHRIKLGYFIVLAVGNSAREHAVEFRMLKLLP